jgi:hypothetical protein
MGDDSPTPSAAGRIRAVLARYSLRVAQASSSRSRSRVNRPPPPPWVQGFCPSRISAREPCARRRPGPERCRAWRMKSLSRRYPSGSPPFPSPGRGRDRDDRRRYGGIVIHRVGNGLDGCLYRVQRKAGGLRALTVPRLAAVLPREPGSCVSRHPALHPMHWRHEEIRLLSAPSVLCTRRLTLWPARLPQPGGWGRLRGRIRHHSLF